MTWPLIVLSSPNMAACQFTNSDCIGTVGERPQVRSAELPSAQRVNPFPPIPVVAAWMLLGLLGLACVRPAGAATPATTVAELRTAIADHLAQSRFAAATWGVKIMSLDTGELLFAHNPGKLLKPASNAKLYTGALALARFGQDYRIRTSFFGSKQPDTNGVLAGDLIIYGRGDPSFAARFNDGDYTKSLQPLVETIAAAGIKHIQGGLIGDESYFHGPPLGTGWSWEDLQYYYGAEVSALTVDDNTVDLLLAAGTRPGARCQITTKPETAILKFINRTRTGARNRERSIHLYRPIGENTVMVTGQLPLGEASYPEAVTVTRPALWFLARLEAGLEQGGIPVDGPTRIAGWQDRPSKPIDYEKLVELGHADSRPMGELVAKMLKDSQNLYAQLLLLQVGAQSPAASSFRTTEEAGLAALHQFLSRADIPTEEVQLEEGAGLSHGSAVTAQATVALLTYMARHRLAEEFFRALPVAGEEGTMRKRMTGIPAASRIHAKPGALHHVSALSGYVTSATGERLVFSLLLNHYQSPPGAPSKQAELDQLALMLAEFNGRSKP